MYINRYARWSILTIYRYAFTASGFDLQADNERRIAYIVALRAADGGDYCPLLAFVGARVKG